MLKLFQSKNRHSISPSIVVFTVMFLSVLYFLYQIRDILALFFLGFLIMVAFNPFVKKLQSKLKFPRFLAVASVYVLFISGLSGLFLLVIPPLAKELYQLVRTFDLPWLQEEMARLSFSLTEMSNLVSQLGSSLSTVYTIVSSTFSGVFTVLTVVFISLFLMLERQDLHMKLFWLTHKKQHLREAEEFLDELEFQLGGWVRGQLILMLTIGAMTYLGLTLLGMPYTVPLALWAGMLEILPNLGPTLAAIPSIIIGFIVGGPVMGLMMLGFYTLIQQVENNFLVPKVMRDNVNVSPLTSMMSILIGLELAGVLGAFLAIPIFIVIRTVYMTWYEKLVK